MEFEFFIGRVYPKLVGIAKKVNTSLISVDEEDLLQEMRLHLWRIWQKGEFEDKTESYLLQGCWFYIKNYLRVVGDKTGVVSIDELVSNERLSPENIFYDNFPSIHEFVIGKIMIENVVGGSLTKREQEVLGLASDGYNLREIGTRLGISFVRVSTIKKHIYKKFES
ncbi:MAG: sigma-70 family RNA polymerase sigma factor [Elusimicrobiota bacterium]